MASPPPPPLGAGFGAVVGQATSDLVPGVNGTATGHHASGVLGTATSDLCKGVEGVGYFGVFGVSTGTGGHAAGVTGKGFGAHGNGVMGFGEGSGAGVYGQCSNGVAVLGRTDGAGGIAVMGYVPQPTNAGPHSFAAIFHGAVNVTGPVHKSGGGFRIDHPDQPETHYLQHCFVESDAMRNLYDGVAVLDATSAAEVSLPAWFTTLNEAFSYQLTALRRPAADLHIAREFADGSFGIGGGHAGQRVSWQITGVRMDPWAVAHRLPADLPKAPLEQGLYRHPELYALPPERGIDYRLTRAVTHKDPPRPEKGG